MARLTLEIQSGLLVTIAQGKVEYAADIFVIAKLHAFDDATIAHIKAGNDTPR